MYIYFFLIYQLKVMNNLFKTITNNLMQCTLKVYVRFISHTLNKS